MDKSDLNDNKYPLSYNQSSNVIDNLDNTVLNTGLEHESIVKHIFY